MHQVIVNATLYDHILSSKYNYTMILEYINILGGAIQGHQSQSRWILHT